MFQITKLLKNSENAASNKKDVNLNIERSHQSFKGNFPIKKNRKIPSLILFVWSAPKALQIPRGGARLTDQLIQQGIISQALLDALRKEWDTDNEDSDRKKPQTDSDRKKTETDMGRRELRSDGRNKRDKERRETNFERQHEDTKYKKSKLSDYYEHDSGKRPKKKSKFKNRK